MNIQIRPLLTGDAAALKLLRVDAATTTPRAIYPTPAEIRAQTIASFQEDIQSANTIAPFGAFVDDALIGFVGLRRDNREKVRHKAQVWGLYVRQTMRQQG